MAKTKTPKYPQKLFVQWSGEGDMAYLSASETPNFAIEEAGETARVAVYTFDRMVTVTSKIEVKE